MSRYTVKGSAELDARIDADLARIAEAASPHSIAGILLGGYGRGEGTPYIHPDGSQTPFNDYDLVVIVESLDPSACRRFKEIEQQLTAELGMMVDLCPYEQHRLPLCEFSLLNYEMKHGHKVVWGDPGMLDAMPDYPHDGIPHSEGLRLLLNRGKLLLDARLRLARPEPLDDEEQLRLFKFIAKAWLALGDSALLADGKYDISYSLKRDRIASIGDLPERDAVIENYRHAVALKEWGDYRTWMETTDIAEAFRQVRDTFLLFFEWYRRKHRMRESPLLKAMALNLKWNRWPYTVHPRKRLYEALPELLKDEPDRVVLGQILCCGREVEERFYKLQKRFS